MYLEAASRDKNTLSYLVAPAEDVANTKGFKLWSNFSESFLKYRDIVT